MLRHASFLAVFACLLGVSRAGEAQQTVKPALAPNPAVTAALAALGDNSSCVLDRKGIIENLGDFAKGWHRMKQTGPCGRDFTIKMAWMPDRKRAFFCGANHGSPHRFNDAWEFDLPSCTWVLLYTPDYNDRGKVGEYDKKTLIIKDGWLRTRKGGPGHPAHTWWGLTYDPKIKAAVWYCAWPGYRLQAKLDAIGKTKENLYKGPPIWAFYPYEKKWDPIPTAKPWPRNKFGASLEYIPELGGSLWQYGAESWLLDATARTWKKLPGQKAGLPIETLVCYDPTRKMMFAHRGPRRQDKPRTWHTTMGPAGPTGWEQVLEKEGLPNGHDARSFMYFDPVSKKPLLYERGPKAIWSYDPEKKEWTKLAPKGPAPPFGEKERVVAYMDTARNVFVAIGYSKVWCYRLKKK
ncbi:MAG: hypothetical protein ACYTGB_11370 [Planctomycetota bacterium]|jgi:hypothetical protein